MSDDFAQVTPSVVDKLVEMLGKEGVLSNRDQMVDYSHDEFSLTEIQHFPDVVVKPATTEQVAQVMKFAHQATIPVTPRGGGTGLCGGCVPVRGGIVLSLERMNKLIEVDKENLMAVAEAGVSLTEFFEAVEGAGLFFPPHPGDEAAMIGGVIATNAGGARAVKYGVIRNFVRGIEVVLSDGETIEIGGKLLKSSTGYSLLNLMIGSEGTLGIITRATINLLPSPAVMYTLVAPFNSLDQAISAVPAIIFNKILPMAVEFLPRDLIEITELHLNKKWPTEQGAASLMIIVDGSTDDDVLALSDKISETCTQYGALDMFVADSLPKQRNVLDIRSQIYEALRKHTLEVLDITIPRARIAEFVHTTNEIGEDTGIWLPSFGHAADGNVHTHVMKDKWTHGSWSAIPGWEEKFPLVRHKLHALGKSMGGVCSGEHGIGVVKREYLPDFVGPRQMDLFRSIKQAFDPKGILNPGKIL